MIGCKNKCKENPKASKVYAYHAGGCYCKTCDQYFTEKFTRCPCCNIATRQKPRSNKRIQNELPRVA